MDQHALDQYLQDLRGKDHQKYVSKQIYRWLYNGCPDFHHMTDIPKILREYLAKNASMDLPRIKMVAESQDTRKFLIELSDKNLVESVVMKYGQKYTACLSSQVGCAMGCGFCASGKNGFRRNLTSGEMVAQAILIQNQLENHRLSNIVFMGTGEPLLNLKNLLIALNNLNKGLLIGGRHITISTCGILEGMRKLAGAGLPVTLSVSLHAPNDEIRQKLMPIAKRVPLEKLMEECRQYFSKTGRRITFEYALIKDVNCKSHHALELAKLIKGINGAHVNLIPLNPVKECEFQRPSKREVQEFLSLLKSKQVNATLRRELGADASGACGQLYAYFT